MTDPVTQISNILDHIGDFTAAFGLIALRPYQIEAADAVIQSILDKDGETFVWKFSRQGGKDETLAALYQYIMTILGHREASIVTAAPTFIPQTQLAINRLADRLSKHIALKRSWKRQAGHIFRIHSARTQFLSAQSHANVVGATAWPLLVMNEAQDISPTVYDKRFAPMAAANNATRLFSGTAWTRDTLLAREERACLLKEKQDGKRRVFVVDGAEIAKVHPPYGKFLESEIARLGANHPIVVSQYLCREIDALTGMFTPARLALMFSDRPPQSDASPIFGVLPQMGEVGRGLGSSPQMGGDGRRPEGGGVGSIDNRKSEIKNLPVAFLIDVAGMDEHPSHLGGGSRSTPQAIGGGVEGEGRDSTTLSIAEIDLSTLEALQAPTYRIMHREAWTGLNHLTVFGKLKAMAEQWRPQHIVIDATGVGEGLWAMLDRAFPTRVIPVKFTQQEKSEIGWRFLSIIETGRFRDCYISSPLRQRSPVGEGLAGGAGAFPAVLGSVNPETVRLQYAMCRSEILPGPAKTLRWGVPDGTRGPDGQLVHDDHIMADALVAKLDELEWHFSSPTLIVQGKDPLEEMSRIR